MSRTLIFVIFILSYSHLAFSYNGTHMVDEQASEMCPYTNFCHKNALKIMSDFTPSWQGPCCFDCYCDDECLALDNCCPDKEFKERPRIPLVTCMDPYVKGRGSNSGPNYRVIDSCPNDKDKPSLNKKCNGENRTSVEDFVWVSDKTGKIYQNIHCAKCHGINQTVSWEIRTTCPDIMTANFVTFQEDLLSEKCSLINTIPEDLKTITTKYKCYNLTDFYHSSCNETGKMTQYNLDLEIACKQSTWPYQFVLGRFAKNIFCYLCNTVSADVSNSELCMVVDGHNTEIAGVTFLIDYIGLTKRHTEERYRCGLDEIFDEYMELCRKVVCPIGTAPSYGSCKHLVTKIDGLVLGIEFYLKNLSNKTSVFTDYKQFTIGEVICTKFLELLALSSDCNICRRRLTLTEGNNSSSDLILLILLGINTECDYAFVLRKMADMRGKVIEIFINGAAVLELFVCSDKQLQIETNGNLEIYSRVNTFDRLCAYDFKVAFADMACLRVELSYEELELFSSNDDQGRDTYASFFTVDEPEKIVPRVSVCWDKYISKMSHLNSAVLYDDKYTIYLLLIVTILLSVINP